MGSRVREFCRANPSTEPSHSTVVKRVEDLLTRADSLGMQQRTGLGDRQAATARRTQIRLQIEFGLLTPLVKVGREAAKTNPGLLGKFRISRTHATHRAFLINARGMLADATAAKEVMVQEGMSPNLLDDLAKALDRFEAESDAINLSRRTHIGARVELSEVADALSNVADVLDGIHRYRFQADPEQLTVWEAARSVIAHSARKTANPTESGASPPAPTDGTTKAA